ncbi:conserved hypothetical protein [Trichinella spiralis]|uniref:hypothetical protein n=1 Tax=Trichinella spiralis TaxID=6334 RepID=UPI0001EFD109|nr:conserved hypothetical protein [Trichinella spiralis]
MDQDNLILHMLVQYCNCKRGSSSRWWVFIGLKYFTNHACMHACMRSIGGWKSGSIEKRHTHTRRERDNERTRERVQFVKGEGEQLVMTSVPRANNWSSNCSGKQDTVASDAPSAESVSQRQLAIR